ncbi:hypothetical protein O181_006808 [Austropuccinia psidii MF-1]|uniref:Uncharacterized protein n=1 Tax=Austropuccinia psidii MF-1 TaxID=1389203 RepID=A0A9Q3GGY3_9BASI|nr:hypothetical protein [Austropuccinia psidii MF-1]
MNVSGLNIDVGNPTSQTSSTWSIPNISVTPIPPNPTNTQMHVSEWPGSTPEISSKANSHLKYPQDFLLNPGRNPVVSQEPFGQSKQPTLNIPSGAQVHVGHENLVDGGWQKRQLENIWNRKERQSNLRSQLKIVSMTSIYYFVSFMAGDEIYASSPLVHKEKLTGRHHPYASKPRTGHASSSREKIVDDED